MSLNARDVSGLVLAGGDGTRMGEDKALVEWGDEPLFRRQLSLLTAIGIGAVGISRAGTQPALDAGVPTVLDALPGKGPLSGIVSGLGWASHPGENGRPLLVLAVDMPLVERDFLRRLLAHAEPARGVAFRVNGRWEPLCAIYPPAALTRAQRLLEEGPSSPTGLVEELASQGMLTSLDLDADEGRVLKSWNVRGEPPGE